MPQMATRWPGAFGAGVMMDVGPIEVCPDDVRACPGKPSIPASDPEPPWPPSALSAVFLLVAVIAFVSDATPPLAGAGPFKATTLLGHRDDLAPNSLAAAKAAVTGRHRRMGLDHSRRGPDRLGRHS